MTVVLYFVFSHLLLIFAGVFVLGIGVSWSIADHYQTSLIAAALDSAAGAIDL